MVDIRIASGKGLGLFHLPLKSRRAGRHLQKGEKGAKCCLTDPFLRERPHEIVSYSPKPSHRALPSVLHGGIVPVHGFLGEDIAGLC